MASDKTFFHDKHFYENEEFRNGSLEKDQVFKCTDAVTGQAKFEYDNDIIDITQTAHGFVVGDQIYFDGTDYVAADATVLTTGAEYTVTRVLSVDRMLIQREGRATVTAHGFTVGQVYYLDETLPGKPTTTKPTTPGVLECRAFKPIDVDTLEIWNDSICLTVGGTSGAINVSTGVSDAAKSIITSPEGRVSHTFKDHSGFSAFVSSYTNENTATRTVKRLVLDQYDMGAWTNQSVSFPSADGTQRTMYDSPENYIAGTSSSSITLPYDGFYMITGNMYFSINDGSANEAIPASLTIRDTTGSTFAVGRPVATFMGQQQAGALVFGGSVSYVFYAGDTRDQIDGSALNSSLSKDINLFLYYSAGAFNINDGNTGANIVPGGLKSNHIQMTYLGNYLGQPSVGYTASLV